MALPMMFRIALIVIGVSTIVFLAGFASSYWAIVDRPYRTKFNFGLWTVCTESGGCVSLDVLLGVTPIHAYIARFCTIYELISVIVSVVLLLLFAFKSPIQRWATSSYSLLLSGGILGFLGAVIFIGREKSLDTGGYVQISWSGVLVILAAMAHIASGVLILLPIKRGQVEFAQV